MYNKWVLLYDGAIVHNAEGDREREGDREKERQRQTDGQTDTQAIVQGRWQTTTFCKEREERDESAANV